MFSKYYLLNTDDKNILRILESRFVIGSFKLITVAFALDFADDLAVDPVGHRNFKLLTWRKVRNAQILCYHWYANWIMLNRLELFSKGQTMQLCQNVLALSNDVGAK